jgi:serine/threonine-protein kinase
LGPYEILSAIGAGGMGEVYRATDSNLKRSVAIKVLPASVAGDPDRLARFQREAEVLAALNHPNIAAIYGLEKTPDVTALVMELVEGEDLSAHISRGAIPLAEALPIAKQIAEALEAAHEQGIVHRDLKPANIKVRSDGTVKVLDFGLAKAMDPAGAASGEAMNSPTMTARATQMGMILGTAAYMAPEQAKGKAIDKRADIWAFGVVLYEMLTGRRLFEAEDVSETLAAVLTRDVSTASLPANFPPRLRALLGDCLLRDPRQRLRDIGDARHALDRIIAGVPDDATTSAGALVQAARSSSRTRERIVWAALLASVGLLLGWRVWRTPAAEPLTMSRFEIPLEAGGIPAISPDGANLVYTEVRAGKSMLYVRGIDQFEAKPLAGTEDGIQPFFSPDGKSIGFAAGGFLKTTSFGAAAVTSVCPMREGGLRGASWGPDNTIVFAMFPGGDSLWRVPATGGTPEALGASHAPRQVTEPQFFPDGRHIIYAVLDGNRQELEVYGLADHAVQSVLTDAYKGHVLASGHLVFVRSEALMLVPFDLGRLSVHGTPVRVSAVMNTFNTGRGDYDVSATGTLVYGPPVRSPDRDLVWMTRQGHESPTGLPAGQYGAVALSSDARRVAAVMMTSQVVGTVSIGDLARGTLTRLGDGFAPVWSPDRRHVAYARDGHLFAADADAGTESEQSLASTTFDSVLSLDWSPDGTAVAFSAAFQQTSHDILTVPVRVGGGTKAGDESRPLVRTSAAEVDPRFSPNGRWLAYVSAGDVFVRAIGGDAARVQVSVAGGVLPRWSASSTELFYVHAGQLWAVQLELSTSGLRPGAAHALFALPPGPWDWFAPWYDVASDGRFLIIKPPAGSAPTYSLRVVVNWAEEIRRDAASRQQSR